ncbi:MAG: DUF45 domain-containing protein [Patescibacteria group bacterium]|nr:DUF45 domain-containing protein [Patescibacteria group bacterium]
MYYLYIVQCKDGSLYTGITTDLKRRLKEHNTSILGAKYTRARGPVRLVYVKDFPDRSSASIAEATTKKLSRIEKVNLIKEARKEHLLKLRLKRKEERLEYLKNKEEARRVILSDLERINEIYKFKYARVAIRDQKTRWGSCSKKKNLNFNYRLLFVSKEEREYVIAHELCHLVEMNHSKNFWDLVASFSTEYKIHKAKLKARSFSKV